MIIEEAKPYKQMHEYVEYALGDRYLYDIYVKSGSHVLFYVGPYGSGIYSRETTTTEDDKTKRYTRSLSYLSAFVLRRF